MQYIITEDNGETKECDHDSQIVRAKENLKLSRSVPSQRQTTNERFRLDRTHRRAVKEETLIAMIAYCREISTLYSTFYQVRLSF